MEIFSSTLELLKFDCVPLISCKFSLCTLLFFRFLSSPFFPLSSFLLLCVCLLRFPTSSFPLPFPCSTSDSFGLLSPRQQPVRRPALLLSALSNFGPRLLPLARLLSDSVVSAGRSRQSVGRAHQSLLSTGPVCPAAIALSSRLSWPTSVWLSLG